MFNSMGLGVEQFITKWQDSEGGQERANYAMFLTELCQVLEVRGPDVAGATTENNDYVFERAVTFTGRDGTKSQGRIDLYKRGSFVLEAKQSRQKGGTKEVKGQNDLFGLSDKPKAKTTRDWDVLMLNARQQAENYARHLPATHEWPPFIVVCDVGHCFEIYADFTGKGRNYTQFPDRQGFRIFLKDLENGETRKLLKAIWQEPLALDPSKKSAKATREIASALAEVSKRLEAKKHPPEEVALFLMRCLFTMFAEDSKLIPEESFTKLLTASVDNPKSFMPNLKELWNAMNSGSEFSVAIQSSVKRFNGKLFADARVFPMEREDIGVLKVAATKDWTEVDPSIFGTLLEQALSPADRSSLGAHYTPRAYVERLVIATVIEPLREEWNNVQGSLEVDADEALARVKAFHQKLCDTKVLDPACGTGNFLYVTLELMKRLEGEVLDTIERLGGQDALRLEKFTVDPHQFLGIEINPRAAAIAELVLWIGYLRWHLKTKGEAPPEPILSEFKNIERRDAVLAHDGVDAKGKFVNPRRPEWPEADYIVGNPPFIPNRNFREKFGDEYVQALKSTYRAFTQAADFVLFFWLQALVKRNNQPLRVGFISTSRLRMKQNRQVFENAIDNEWNIAYAIPDHDWPADADAAVRVCFVMVTKQLVMPQLIFAPDHEMVKRKGNSEKIEYISQFVTKISTDLTADFDTNDLVKMKSNEGLCYAGVKPYSRGLHIDNDLRNSLFQSKEDQQKFAPKIFNGRDVGQRSRGVYVLDLRGLTEKEVRDRLPQVYQYLVEVVKPERADERNPRLRRDYWLFEANRDEMRKALIGQSRYICTLENSPQRYFVFLPSDILPDLKLRVVAQNDGYVFGILNSHIHTAFSIRIGGRAGAANTPVYNTDCFVKFSFPIAGDDQRAKIAELAEALDAHRKTVQAEHPEITLTQMYNVLEKVRAGSAAVPPYPSPLAGEGGPLGPDEGVVAMGLAPPTPHPSRAKKEGAIHLLPQGEKGRKEVELTADEKLIFDHALILILKERHEELDAAVAAAYGWTPDLSDDDILTRLVALNKERAAEEARGIVRWLRPDYQIPRFGSAAEKQEQLEADLVAPALAPAAKSTFPVGAVEQTAALMHALAQSSTALTATEIALQFKQGKKALPRVEATLSSLLRTGFIFASEGGKRFALRRAA